MEYGTVLALANEDLAPRDLASKTLGNHLVNGLRLRTFNGTLDLMGVCVQQAFLRKSDSLSQEEGVATGTPVKTWALFDSRSPAVPVPL